MPVESKSRKAEIKASFARSVRSYERASQLQARVAVRLGELLADFERPQILELGCGTGHFTRTLLQRYPMGEFLVSDFCRDMIGACKKSIEAVAGSEAKSTFKVIDADRLSTSRKFDVVGSSMALHWCDDPGLSLELQRACLKPGGRVVYATIGGDNFSQWRQVLDELGLESGVRPAPSLPGIKFEERVAVDFGSARGFLCALKMTGAAVARQGYRPLGPTDLKRACGLFDARFGGTVTWHVVYGVVEAEALRFRARTRQAASV